MIPRMDDRIQEISRRLREGIDIARGRGWKLAPNVTACNGLCCPIGAVCVTQDLPVNDLILASKISGLGLTDQEAYDFGAGFDAPENPGTEPLRELGRLFRQDYL